MLSLVHREIPEAILALAGDTEGETQQQPLLREHAAAAEVADHVLRTGWLPMLEAWSYVRTAEVALPPIPRGQLLGCSSPTKVPEHLMLGMPVACNDNPDQERIMLESGGGICCRFTAEDFAKAAIELMRVDAPTRQRMVAAGRNYVIEHRDYRVLSTRVAKSSVRLFDNRVPGNGATDPAEDIA